MPFQVQLAPWLTLRPAMPLPASGSLHKLFPRPETCSLHPVNTYFPSRFQFCVTSSRGLLQSYQANTSPQKATHDYLCAPKYLLSVQHMPLLFPQLLSLLSPLTPPHVLASLHDSSVPEVLWPPVLSTPQLGLVLCSSASHHCGRPDTFHSDQDGACGPHVPQHRVTSPSRVLEQGRNPAGSKGQRLPSLALW